MRIDDVPLIMAHHSHCAAKAQGHSDAARRIADTITTHWLAIGWESRGKWLAFALQDGRGGMDLFDSKAQAVAHQSNPGRFVYVCLAPGGMSACEAEVLLKTARKIKDWDTHQGNHDLIPRVAAEHRNAILKMLGG